MLEWRGVLCICGARGCMVISPLPILEMPLSRQNSAFGSTLLNQPQLLTCIRNCLPVLQFQSESFFWKKTEKCYKIFSPKGNSSATDRKQRHIQRQDWICSRQIHKEKEEKVSSVVEIRICSSSQIICRLNTFAVLRWQVWGSYYNH